MFRTITLVCMALAFVLGSLSPGFATEEGNKRKGKYTYRKVYNACFERGEVQEAKPPVNPDAHTQAEWTKIFDDKMFDEFGCKEEWDALTDEQMLDIYAYLYGHASDSPTPAKCK